MNLFIDTLRVYSPVFGDKGNIPMKYTCEGENINPPLAINELPSETKSLAIIVEDPDATHGTFDHWVIWDIEPQTNISENFMGGVQGKNGKQKTGYTGPCPPSGIHRYYFKVYALDTKLELPNAENKKALIDAMRGHIIAGGEIMGKYSKSK